MFVAGDPQEDCSRCGKTYLSGPTKDGVCPKCKNLNNNTPITDSTAEESSGNQTEDSISHE